ncbi:MAG: hypothetical protein ACR2OC_04700 [Solirubrobacterales bacterium]
MSEPLAFLIRVAEGNLAAQSELFVESLRRWGGELAETPVYAFTSPDDTPGEATIARLVELGATHVELDLEARRRDPPVLNKVYVCAWAERELEFETLCFSDTDTVILNEPRDLVEGEWLAASKPVGSSRAGGSKGPEKRNERYWQRLYAELGVRSEPWVTSVVDRKRIRAYWNTGLVAARRSAGLFGTWEEALEQLFERDVVFRKPVLMEQLAWSGVTADIHDRVWELPDPYNYPLPKRRFLPEEMQALDLGHLVHVHLHKWAHLDGFLTEVLPALDSGSERYEWLAERLPLEPQIEGPFRWAD